MFLRKPQDRIDRMLVRRAARCGQVARVAEPVRAVPERLAELAPPPAPPALRPADTAATPAPPT